jgi:lysozyme
MATAQEYNVWASQNVWKQEQLPRTWAGKKLAPSSSGFAQLVKNFQIAACLRADGKLGPGSWDKMQRILGREVLGIDVSKYQGRINFAAVRAAGYEFVIIKATEGEDWKDPTLIQNALAAAQAGMKILYYHFGTPHTLTKPTAAADAAAEAHDFLEAIVSLPKPTVLHTTASNRRRHASVYLDLEKDAPNLTKQEGLIWVQTWTIEVEKYLPIGYYTNDDWFTDEVADYYTLVQRPDESYRPIWVARYGTNDGTMQPQYDPEDKVPEEWGTYDIWQYLSRGDVPGVDGNCDVNVTTLLLT